MSNVLGLLTNKVLWIALAFGALFGAYKLEGYRVKAAATKIEGLTKSLNMAEFELQDAAETAAHNKSVADSFKEEVMRQKSIIAAEAKKSRERLAAFNALNRKIGNVPPSENVPVSNHLELVLDELRSPVAGSGPPADSPDETGDGGKAENSGGNLPPKTDATAETPVS